LEVGRWVVANPVTGLLNNVFGAIFSWITKKQYLVLFSQGWVGVFTGANRGDWTEFLGLAGLEPVASVATVAG